jgi:hypothetical protein
MIDPEILHQAPYVAIAAAVGFMLLAFVLLYPVWRFLNREEEVSRHWTAETLARNNYLTPQGGDGAADDPELASPGSAAD